MSTAPETLLVRRAVKALIRWRAKWERKYAVAPCIDNGSDSTEMDLWKIAGQLMVCAGKRRRLPG